MYCLALTVLFLVSACGAGANGTLSQTAGDVQAGSNADTAQAGGQEEAPASFTIFRMESSNTTIPPEDTPVGKKLQELTNVNISIEYLVGTDVRQKASLMIAGGDYPDLILPADASGDFLAAGAFVNLSEWIEGSENLKNNYTDVEMNLMKASSDDGGIYWLPCGGKANEDRLYPAAGYYLNMDLLKENDYPVVTSFEQWQDLVIDYVKKHPDYNGQTTIGFTLPTEGWRASGLQYGGSRFLAGYPNDGVTVVDQETLEMKLIMDQDFEKDFFRMINRMWNEGAADKEMFMQTNDQYNQKISSGRVVSLYDQRSMFIDALNALGDAKLYDRMLVAWPAVLDGVDTERYRGPRNFSAGSGLGITTSCKDPERLFEFLDTVASEEVQKLLYWGVEGEDYTMDGGKMTRGADQWANALSTDYKNKQGLEKFNTLFWFKGALETFSTGEPVDPTKTQEYADLRYQDYEKEFLGHYNVSTFCDLFNPSYDAYYEPGWAIRQKIPTDNPGKVAIETALEITREWAPKMAQGTPDAFDGIWDAYVAELDKLPLGEYLDLANKMILETADIYKN
jgi:ABC-type glycerol-3-phosphate transport system substrate-binding protein